MWRGEGRRGEREGVLLGGGEGGKVLLRGGEEVRAGGVERGGGEGVREGVLLRGGEEVRVGGVERGGEEGREGRCVAKGRGQWCAFCG